MVRGPPATSNGRRFRQQLPYNHTCGMVNHMKTTLNIDDTVMKQLKREAVNQGRTMSYLVETALRLLFNAQKKHQELPPLPSFHGGGDLVDIFGSRSALQGNRRGRRRTVVLVVDTNVLVYAADEDSRFHGPCREWLDRQMAESMRGTPPGPFCTSSSASPPIRE